VKLDRRWVVIFFAGILALIPNACGESVTVGCGSSVAVSGGSSAEGNLASDGTVTQSSVSSVGVIDDLNIDPWVQNTNGDYAEIGVTGTNVAGFTYSDNYYPVKDQVGVSDAVWAQQWIGASSADSLHAYARASNSAGDNAGSNLDISYGSLKGYYNAAYAGPASWLGIDRGAFVQQTLDSAKASKIVAQTWAVDPAGDAAGALTDVRNGDLTGYSVVAASAGYSNGLRAAGVSVDSMSASSPSGSIYQVMNTYNSTGDTSTVSLDKATTLTGYDGKAYAYDATASATETGHVTGPFVGTANVGTVTTTRTPNFGSEYDLSMSAATGSAPIGNLGYYINPKMGIQNAVNIAQGGDAINLAAGTYLENIKIDKSITIKGVDSTKTIVDGQQSGSVFNIGSVNPNIDVTLYGLGITGGLRSTVDTDGVGGGVYNQGRTKIENCRIFANSASFGGGIYNDGTGAELTVIDSTISGNGALQGGGIYNNGTSAKVIIMDSIISGNSAVTLPGGIHNEGIATISNSTISGNSAKYIGGIDNLGTMIIYDSTISENRAYWYGSVSGIANSGILTISNSTLTRNSAGNTDLAGYPCISNSGILAISHSTISKNYAGGISNSGTATISGSTISENFDSGISNSGPMTINDSMISGNTGSGIYWANFRPAIDSKTVITGNSEPQIYPY
jgi:hypothetical protein